MSQSSMQVDPNEISLSFLYRFDSTAGAGVDIYVVDTGINADHASVLLICFSANVTSL